MLGASSSRCWLFWIGWLFATWTLAGCGDPMYARRPDTTQARARSVDWAVIQIVHARCDLERHCANIGPGQKFPTRAVCESKMYGETTHHLNMSDCPLGVEPRKLDACVASIYAQDCGNLFDRLSRWNACRKGNLCYR